MLAGIKKAALTNCGWNGRQDCKHRYKFGKPFPDKNLSSVHEAERKGDKNVKRKGGDDRLQE